YQATGVITRKAGTAATIKYHWVRDGQAGDEQTATFANGTATATLAWHHAGREEKAGTRHTVELRLTGGKGNATKTYTFTCKEAPEADVRIADLEVGAYNGSCTPPPQLTARAALQASQAGTVEYHWVVDGKASAGEKHTFTAPGQTRVDHVFTATRPGKVELVVDNYNKPRAAYDFHVTCNTNDPQPVVALSPLVSDVAEDAGLCPWSMRVSSMVSADRAATVRFRWMVNGSAQPEQSLTLKAGEEQKIMRPVFFSASRTERLTLEVLSQNEPSRTDSFAWTCHTVGADIPQVHPATYHGKCAEGSFRVSVALRSFTAQTVKYQYIDKNGDPLEGKTLTYTFTGQGTTGLSTAFALRKWDGTVRVKILEPAGGLVTKPAPLKITCTDRD
ncbi:hypothetical protein, partial [Nonomuraea sp. NPDC050310]|uniref:hypothetical protein n=1 Tax=Nonomuraea sp. NPDC050310 TaxID=3154935 RepID=UPI00340F7CA5